MRHRHLEISTLELHDMAASHSIVTQEVEVVTTNLDPRELIWE